jgi:hypothetical protein
MRATAFPLYFGLSDLTFGQANLGTIHRLHFPRMAACRTGGFDRWPRSTNGGRPIGYVAAGVGSHQCAAMNAAEVYRSAKSIVGTASTRLSWHAGRRTIAEKGSSSMSVSRDGTRVRATTRWYRRSLSFTDGTLVTIILSFWVTEVLWTIGKHILAYLP